MDYISVKAASEKWGISERRIQKLCEENRIDGTEKFGRAWMIPKDAEKLVEYKDGDDSYSVFVTIEDGDTLILPFPYTLTISGGAKFK